MEEHYMEITKTARYYLSGLRNAEYKGVCFVLHGYGQLASYFIRNFKIPALSDILFIAPEGLHRFYLKDSKGRVGASWMTKEDRLKDIADYCNYLDQLYKAFEDIVKAKPVGILGFSQGVATACRWLAASSHHFDYLINYAGAFPPDLDQRMAMAKMQNIPIHLLVGNQDEYISEAQFKEHLAQLGDYKVKARVFEGRHKIYPAVLEGVFKEIEAEL